MKKNRSIIKLTVLMIAVMICMVIQSYNKGYIRTKKVSYIYHTEQPVKNDTDNKIDKSYEKLKEEKKTKSPERKKGYKSNPDIKVLITTTENKSIFHDKIIIKSKKPFKVINGKNIKRYKGGKSVVFKTPLKNKKSIIVKSCSNEKLQVMSVKRQAGYPSYRGMFQIKPEKDGMILKNILPLEKYLYSVVPSEMPAESEMSALKAQAVCARSFAYSMIKSNRYKQYNADVDDSTSCQVYNNFFENKKTVKAVDDTKDKVIMTKNNKVALGYYFATSWGCTADGKEVWDTAQAVSYLKGMMQNTEKLSKKREKDIKLSDENSFRRFIDKTIYTTYDSSDKWYRWKTVIKEETMCKRINSLLYSCHVSNKKNVLIRNKSGKYKKGVLKSIGTVKNIRVEKRDKSGLVSELVVAGNKGTVKVCGQYNIRKVLAPLYENVKRKDGSIVNGMSLLPSAAFYINKENGKFIIKGGGFGHGSGMSQTGACKMAEAGFDYKDILKHYYNGVLVEDIAKANI